MRAKSEFATENDLLASPEGTTSRMTRPLSDRRSWISAPYSSSIVSSVINTAVVEDSERSKTSFVKIPSPIRTSYFPPEVSTSTLFTEKHQDLGDHFIYRCGCIDNNVS